jgi:FeS assembly protein IscX
MGLSWANQTAIAAALVEAYPDMDRLSLKHEDVLRLILDLPGFNDRPVPPQPVCLSHILWTWMRLADVAGGFREKERRRL